MTYVFIKSTSNNHVTNVASQHVYITTNRKEQCYVIDAQQVRNCEIGFNSKDVVQLELRDNKKPYKRELSNVHYIHKEYLKNPNSLYV